MAGFAAYSQVLQIETVSGTITDDVGDPLIGVNVRIDGRSTGTATDFDGHYSLQDVPSDATLIFSYIGFETQEIPVNGRSVIDVIMKSDAQLLDEVVVVGYGSVRRQDVTGSIVSLQSDNFNQGIQVAPDQLIQGKMPGVMVLNNTGQPGGSTTVSIRGNSSIRAGNNPLFVLDGIPLSGGSARPGGSGGFGSDDGNPLSYLNPNDIASIDVLKDASATAIYGSRGANGVVIINTKSGTTGAPRVTASASLGFSNLLHKPEVLSADEFREALSFYTPNDAANADFGGDVDAFDEITRVAPTQNHNVAITGGTESGRYRLSLGYLNQDGIVKNSNLEKLTANLSGKFQFLESKRLRLDFNLLYTQTKEQIAPIDVNVGFEGNVIAQALNWNPTQPLRQSNGELTWISSNRVNPLASLQAFDDRANVGTVIASISPSVQIIDGLEYKLSYSLTRQTGTRQGMYDRLLIDPTNSAKGMAFIGNNLNTDHQLTHTLNYNKQLTQNFNLNALVGYEYLNYDSRWNSVSGTGFTNQGLAFYDYLGYTSSAGRSINSNRSPVNELQSFFVRAGFNWMDKYLLTGTVRRDGSTKFGENNKYANFPSVAFAWNIFNEDFFPETGIDNLKLRIGWGQTGNSEFPSGASKNRYVFGMQSLEQTNFGNPDLKWETSTTWNAGIDFALWDYRLTGVVDFFRKVTTDALFERTIAQPAPNGKIWVNLDGEIVNKGVEIQLNGNIVRGNNWNWGIGTNMTFLDNEVTGLLGFYETARLRGQGFSNVVGQRMVSGQPLNVWYLSIFEGIDPSSGLSKYRSLTGEVGTEVDPAQNKTYVNSPNPTTLLGLSTDVSYKNLTAVFNFNGAFGHYLFNNTLATVLGLNNLSGRNISPVYFQPDLNESVANSASPSTRYLEKGNYLKLSNASIQYNLGNIGNAIRNLRLSVTGQNLLVFTKYRGFDPEVNTDGSANGIPSLGIEYIPYPSARTFLFGIQFTF